MKGKAFAALGIVLLLATVAEAQIGRQHQRRSWYIGFGLGSGEGWATSDGESKSFGEWFDLFDMEPTRVTLNFKVGATLTPNLLVGFDMTAIRAFASETVMGETLDVAFQANNYDGMVTYFPSGEGFFIRGGLGLAAFVTQWSGPGISETDTVSGFGIVFGGGYAFWLLKSFNLTLNADYSLQSYGEGDGPDSSSFLNIYLGFDWY